MVDMHKSNIKCPHCHKAYYEELYSFSPVLEWAPKYKDGELLNKNSALKSTFYYCCNCGKLFSYKN